MPKRVEVQMVSPADDVEYLDYQQITLKDGFLHIVLVDGTIVSHSAASMVDFTIFPDGL